MPYICTVCGSNEQDCKCPRFCLLCKSDNNVRLTVEGYYYCVDCREMCGLTAEETFRGI